MRSRRLSVWGLFLVVALVTLSVVPSSAAGRTGDPPRRLAARVPLTSGVLRQTLLRLEAGRPAPAGVDVIGDQVRVEIVVHGDFQAVSATVRDMGGTIEGGVPPVLLQALVPAASLVALEAVDGVSNVRPPLTANEPQVDVGPGRTIQTGAVLGAHVQKTNAGAWHTAGFTGAGVQVGIVDYFDGTTWNAAQASGDVPVPSGTFCRFNGAGCNIWGSGSEHGVAVAEVIYDMAPGVQIFLASALTASDLQAAVDYFAANGVDIISRSLTAEYDGPGNGTGPIAQVINNAVSAGITWLNSAGNSAGATQGDGSYWRGSWSDPDADGWLNFTPAYEEMFFACGFVNGLRWSDWGSARTDYDVYVYEDLADAATPDTFKAASYDNQGTGASPLEHLNDVLPCGTSPDWDVLKIALYSPGSGTAGDVLEFMTNGLPVEFSSNPYSASGPASDTASPGALAVGAIDPALGTTIASYSSWGPTNDGRMKPELSAASCVSTVAYGADCFNGTSAATPVVAGAVALIRQSGVAMTPAAIKSYLLTQAVVDRGAPGGDNVYGAGELRLPAPPTGPPPTGPTITSFNPTSGPVGTSVVIVGTNLTGATLVTFGGAAAVFAVNSATQITATVPPGALTGQIGVTTPSGSALSPGVFTVTSGGGADHARAVSFFRTSNRAKGKVTVLDGFSACAAGVPLKLQEKRSHWVTVATGTTAAAGGFRATGLELQTRYRIVAPRKILATGDVCLKATSPTLLWT